MLVRAGRLHRSRRRLALHVLRGSSHPPKPDRPKRASRTSGPDTHVRGAASFLAAGRDAIARSCLPYRIFMASTGASRHHRSPARLAALFQAGVSLEGERPRHPLNGAALLSCQASRRVVSLAYVSGSGKLVASNREANRDVGRSVPDQTGGYPWRCRWSWSCCSGRLAGIGAAPLELCSVVVVSPARERRDDLLRIIVSRIEALRDQAGGTRFVIT